jgi:RND family efflux transporter MFP subunit
MQPVAAGQLRPVGPTAWASATKQRPMPKTDLQHLLPGLYDKQIQPGLTSGGLAVVGDQVPWYGLGLGGRDEQEYANVTCACGYERNPVRRKERQPGSANSNWRFPMGAQSMVKAGILFLAAGFLAAAGCDQKHPQAAETPPPVVLVSRPLERKVTGYQVFTARTQAKKSVDVKARVSGFLTEILVEDGADVKKGDVLFQIDDRPYKAALDQAKATLSRAKASLGVAEAALVEAQANYQIGQDTQKNQPGAISKQEIVRRLGARDEAKANVEVAKASIGQAQAALEMAQLNYDWCKVAAPISGRATRHLVNAGDMVTQGVTVLDNIVSLKPVWAYFDVDQNTAQQVQIFIREGKIQSARKGEIPVGMNVEVGNDETFPIAGTIDYVSNQLDPNTGSIQVRAVFPNKDETLVAGLFARIRVPIAAPHDALLVNDRAIGTDQGQRFIVVVNDKNEVERRMVEVGQLHDGLREVYRFRTVMKPGRDGKAVARKVEVLKPTDWLVVEGLMRARPGDKVEPRHVDMQTLLPADGDAKKTAPPSAGK